MKNGITRPDITLVNWRLRPWSTWTFHNASDIVPSTIIRGARLPETARRGLGGLEKLAVRDTAGAGMALPDFLATSESDAFVVMRSGEIVAEWYADYCDPLKPHMIFSISKSVTGLLAGVLVGRGVISPDDRGDQFVPEAKGSAYGDVTLRDLLNMNVSIDFDETYLDRNGMFDRYRRSMLWNPENPADPAPDLKTFLCTIPKAGHDHGTRHAYRSPNVDMAAILLEKAAGERFGQLFSDLIWQPMGAHDDAQITVDRAGNPRASGGMSMTARDLARLGELVRCGGRGIVPEDWISELWQGGNRAIWTAGDQSYLYPGGSYRHYWYDTGLGPLAGMGIHGQWLWIDPATETVIVRLSSESVPINDDLDQAVIRIMQAISKTAI
ncbi:serine hydrolase domain-containing protein [Agrobacterium tumefaciens]|uniref:serine hydrolase domain-containing protein n=1 Tax=Agrobacterium tumefaciens TaxID=358 RepID=UPI00384B2D0C